MLSHTVFRRYPDMYRKYAGFMHGFNTPSKKVELYSQRLHDLGYDPLPIYREPAESPVSRPDLAADYPFVLIGGSKMTMYTHTMMRNIAPLRTQAPHAVAELHPETAAGLDIVDGDQVMVSSPRGSIRTYAQVTDRIAPRVVHVSYGFEDANANLLTDSETCGPITGSTGLKSSLCRVEKISVQI